MFRKPVSTGTTHKVSGADRKKLRRALEAQLARQLGVDPDAAALDALLPPKAGDLEQAKLSAPARGLVYSLDGVALLFDPSGKGDTLVPTAMALWRAPSLLPPLRLKHPAVSQFIVGAAHGRHGHGADVMLPGIDVGALPPFQKGDLVAVVIPGNPAPIAVGRAAFGSGDMAEAGAAGGKGKAVEVLQAYGDFLWAAAAGAPVANEGFLETSVAPLPGLWDGGGDDDGGEACAGAGGEGEGAGEGKGGAEGEPAAAAAAPAAEGAAGAPAAGEGPPMEALLEAALLQALHKSVKDGDLPLAGSMLWAQHILPHRPPGSTLDVKKSRHKKMAKFLQVYAKAGLLSGKEDKAGDFLVSAVHRGHALYEGYTPFKAAAATEGGGGVGGGGGGDGGGGNGGGGGGGELVMQELFKVTREVKPIFEAVGAAGDALYTAHEAFDVAQAYVKAAKLEEGAPDARSLLLDAALCDALLKGVVKKGELFPTTLPKAELRERFLARMQPQLLVSRGAAKALRKGPPPPVHIAAEKRMGNKRVTRVSGLEAYLVDAEAFSAELRSKLACSTTVVELPGKANPGHEVVVQGAVVDKVAAHLMEAYGIPKKVILAKNL